MTFLQLTYHLESFRKGGLYWFVPECGEYIRIFLSKKFVRKFVRVKFVSTNIFGHWSMSVLECNN